MVKKIDAGITESVKDSAAIPELLVTALTAENSRLQKRIAQLEAKNISLKHRICVLEKYRLDHPDITSMTDSELMAETT